MNLIAYCLYHITKHYKMPFSIKDIDQHFYNIYIRNNLVELQNAAKKLGLKTCVTINTNWEEIKYAPTPSILFKLNDEESFVILTKVNKWSISTINPKTNKKQRIFRFCLFNNHLIGIVALLPESEM